MARCINSQTVANTFGAIRKIIADRVHFIAAVLPEQIRDPVPATAQSDHAELELAIERRRLGHRRCRLLRRLEVGIVGGVTDLAAADLWITYNTGLVDLANSDVTINSTLDSDWTLVKNVDDSTGIARFGLYTSGDPISSAGDLGLFNMAFHVPAPVQTSSRLPSSLTPQTGVEAELPSRRNVVRLM